MPNTPSNLTKAALVPSFIQPSLRAYNNSFQICYRGKAPLGKSFPIILEGCEASGKLRLMLPEEGKAQYAKEGYQPPADAKIIKELDTWGGRPSYQIVVSAQGPEFFKTAEAIHAKLSALYELVPEAQNAAFKTEMEDPSSRTGHYAAPSKTVH